MCLVIQVASIRNLSVYIWKQVLLGFQMIEYWHFLIGIYYMQGWTATTKHGVTRKRNAKRLKHTGNLSRKNLQFKEVC